MKSSVLCVGILSPGDMGHGIARVLVNNKVEVITCLAGTCIIESLHQHVSRAISKNKQACGSSRDEGSGE